MMPALTVGKALDVELLGGDGGIQNKSGDYLYEDTKPERFVEGGSWIIMRVRNDTAVV